LEGNGLRGPFALADNIIDQQVDVRSPGAFALGDSHNGDEFKAAFVGSSELDVNNQLHVYVGTYRRFKFVYCASARAAFEKECQLFHDFAPRDNLTHPPRPARSDWTCPRCNLIS
jgi:hypothetical protein